MLISGVNDEVAHAAELAALLKTHALERGHVNLIPYNPIDPGDVDGGAADAGANTNDDYLGFQVSFIFLFFIFCFLLTVTFHPNF